MSLATEAKVNMFASVIAPRCHELGCPLLVQTDDQEPFCMVVKKARRLKKTFDENGHPLLRVQINKLATEGFAHEIHRRCGQDYAFRVEQDKV